MEKDIMYGLMYMPGPDDREVIIGFKSIDMAWNFQSRYLSCGPCELADFLDQWDENSDDVDEVCINHCSGEYSVVDESDLQSDEKRIHYKDWVLKYRPLRIGEPKNASKNEERTIGGCYPV